MVLNRSINGAKLTLIKGDITDLDIEAFVFYAQDDLELGSGFGAAIAARGGPSVKEELAGVGSVPSLGAVVSSAGNMKAQHIVHANGPKFQETDTEAKLKKTMQSTLAAIEAKGITKIAFPGMGTGFYGIPKPVSAKIMLDSFTEHMTKGSKIEEIVVCLMETREFSAFETVFKN